MKHYRIAMTLIWTTLIVTTLVSLVAFPLFETNTFVMTNLNPFTLMIFSLMGIWPLFFLYIGWLHQVPFTKKQWLSVWGGFVLGSFIVLPAFWKVEIPARRFFTYNRILWLFNLLFLPIIIIAGFVQGDVFAYLGQFGHDLLITIMTLDFIAFYAASIVIAFQTSYRPWWSLLPMVGFVIAQLPSKAQADV